MFDLHAFVSAAIAARPMLMLTLTYRDDADVQVRGSFVSWFTFLVYMLVHGFLDSLFICWCTARQHAHEPGQRVGAKG